MFEIDQHCPAVIEFYEHTVMKKFTDLLKEDPDYFEDGAIAAFDKWEANHRQECEKCRKYYEQNHGV